MFYIRPTDNWVISRASTYVNASVIYGAPKRLRNERKECERERTNERTEERPDAEVPSHMRVNWHVHHPPSRIFYALDTRGTGVTRRCRFALNHGLIGDTADGVGDVKRDNLDKTPASDLHKIVLIKQKYVFLFAEPLLEPRFITQPVNSGNILSENRTKFLQCQARGE